MWNRRNAHMRQAGMLLAMLALAAGAARAELQVTEVTEDDLPVCGRLLFHGKSRDELHREAMKVRGLDTYAFFTGEPVPPDMIPVL